MEASSKNQLQVIGAGFGRTGTLSMRAALAILGFGPVHHMFEVVKAPEQSADWLRALDDSNVLRDLLANYRSAVDWPTCYFWRQLMDMYPDAKVILTHRDPKAWYKSIRNTIYRLLTAKTSDMPSDQVEMARRIVMDNTFSGRLGEEDYAVEVFEKHNALVKATVPAERLLAFDVREGWQPLCDFLGVPIPDQPFPKTNSTEELIAHFKRK